MRAAIRGALGAAALVALGGGCASVPTPLAPGVRGSVGSPAFGLLTGGATLPEKGSGFRRLRPWAPTNHGTSGLVATLTAAAAQASGPDDPPLVVGDMSGPRGGPLPGHHSHRAGRDVDLLFFYTTPGGAPVESPGFVRVLPDGLARPDPAVADFVRFDVERNWRLVRALLTSPHARPQWLFVVSHLEARLIEYARALGEPPALIWQAEGVLHQPGDSAPHDDHFHLRIACDLAEEAAGCVNGAPLWPWWPVPVAPLEELGPDDAFDG